MSLARAFTTRRAKASADLGDGSSIPSRSKTLHKTSSQQPLRHKISAPVNLVHTTNMLSYNAPDITPQRPSRSDSLGEEAKQDDESDSVRTSESTPPTSPDGETRETSLPKPNHLSSYFMAPGSSETTTHIAPPAIPKRSPSHTKKTSIDALNRKRSMSRMSKDSEQSNPSLTFSRSSSTSTRTSSQSHHSTPYTLKQAPPPVPESAVKMAAITHGPTKPAASPFGQELAQVTELAEEFSSKGRLDIIYEDEQYMRSHGLARMTADDYLNEIHSVMATFWPEASHAANSPPMWI